MEERSVFHWALKDIPKKEIEIGLLQILGKTALLANETGQIQEAAVSLVPEVSSQVYLRKARPVYIVTAVMKVFLDLTQLS
ncbi:hypothetical protein [Gracilinema caldarium]|uniref:hypothetical protein n=1 Tax=Gracilinema caldarium TaxID=215591 RepID=UPI0026ED1383|nr:hypothetical protein [Gracilinema caldarium]